MKEAPVRRAKKRYKSDNKRTYGFLEAGCSRFLLRTWCFSISIPYNIVLAVAVGDGGERGERGFVGWMEGGMEGCNTIRK